MLRTGGWLTDFLTDMQVLGSKGQAITVLFYSLGNEMSHADGWLPRTRGKYIVTGSKIIIDREDASVITELNSISDELDDLLN